MHHETRKLFHPKYFVWQTKIGQSNHFHNFPYFCTTIGNYSCLLAELHLSRSLGFHMVQSYLPTILIVVISWVSFWMDVDSVAGRTTLGVTTLLTVSSKASGTYTRVRRVMEFLTRGIKIKVIKMTFAILN